MLIPTYSNVHRGSILGIWTWQGPAWPILMKVGPRSVRICTSRCARFGELAWNLTKRVEKKTLGFLGAGFLQDNFSIKCGPMDRNLQGTALKRIKLILRPVQVPNRPEGWPKKMFNSTGLSPKRYLVWCFGTWTWGETTCETGVDGYGHGRCYITWGDKVSVPGWLGLSHQPCFRSHDDFTAPQVRLPFPSSPPKDAEFVGPYFGEGAQIESQLVVNHRFCLTWGWIVGWEELKV